MYNEDFKAHLSASCTMFKKNNILKNSLLVFAL